MIKIYDIQAFEAMYDRLTVGYDPKVEGQVFSIMQWGQQVTDMYHVDETIRKLDLHRLDSALLVALVRGLVHHRRWLTEWPDLIADIKEHLDYRGEFLLTEKVEMYATMGNQSE